MKDIWKENWLNKLGLLFFVFSALSLVGAISVFVYAFKVSNSTMYNWAGVWVTMAGVLAALGAYLLVQGKNLAEKDEQRSRLYFDSCVFAYEEAMQILKDGNNDRVKWIQAGRAVMSAKAFEKEIANALHLRILEVHLLKYRNFFAGVLKKQAIDFYGVSPEFMRKIKSFDKEKMLDRAGTRSIGAELPFPYEQQDTDVRPIEAESLYAIWLAAQYPADYWKQDMLPPFPLFSEKERQDLADDYPGLAEYLDFSEYMNDELLSLPVS